MRIEYIEVWNFNGFDHRRFDFDDRPILFLGENGSGKTSVMEAAAVILGAWIGAETGGIPFELENSIRWVGTVEGSGVVFAPAGLLRYGACLAFPTITNTLIRVPVEVSVPKDSVSNSSRKELRNKVTTARTQAEQVLKGVLPVCAFYRADRAFQRDSSADWNKIMSSHAKRHDGYDGWNRSGTVAKDLHEWLGTQEAIHFQEGTEPTAARAVKHAITACLPGSRNVRFLAKYGEPIVEWEDGSITGYSRLSDGQRMILALVGDIARRCAQLNPHLGALAPSDTPGVVLIDEIDLHLHPRWQRRIMEDLRRVFPKVQFIATTHSPVIISAARGAKVIELDASGFHEVGQAYGLDVGWIVDEVMGGESRPAEISRIIHEADELIGEGKLEEARSAVARLKEALNGPDPEVVRLESTIENLESLAHATD